MRGFNTTRRTKKRNHTSRKASRNTNREDPTLAFDRWHLDPIPLKADLTPKQEEFVKELLAKIAYENSAEGQEAMRAAYFEKHRKQRSTRGLKERASS